MGDPFRKHVLDLVNRSGYLLQLAVARQIAESQDRGLHGWKVLVEEHPWVDASTGAQGFVDLVIGRPNLRLVVECKRPGGGEWVFLVPLADNQSNAISPRCAWTGCEKDKPILSGWHDFQSSPGAYESKFCVVGGQDERAPMLEKLASQLAVATEAIAEEEMRLARSRGKTEHLILVPTIVTTAPLIVCHTDADAVSIATGKLHDAPLAHSEHFVWFRKSLATHLPDDDQPRDLLRANLERERSILVIAASHLVPVLHSLEVSGPNPWLWHRREN